MPIVIGWLAFLTVRFGLCRVMTLFFMAGLLLHLECVSIGSLSHPAGAGLLIPSPLLPSTSQQAFQSRD